MNQYYHHQSSKANDVTSVHSTRNDNGGSEIASYSEIINYLSPEYVACIGHNANFSESDIEKVSFSF